MSSFYGTFATLLDGNSEIYDEDKVKYVQIVKGLPTKKQDIGVLYINIEDERGYIWLNNSWKIIFESIADGRDWLEQRLGPIQTKTVKEYIDNLVAIEKENILNTMQTVKQEAIDEAIVYINKALVIEDF